MWSSASAASAAYATFAAAAKWAWGSAAHICMPRQKKQCHHLASHVDGGEHACWAHVTWAGRSDAVDLTTGRPVGGHTRYTVGTGPWWGTALQWSLDMRWGHSADAHISGNVGNTAYKHTIVRTGDSQHRTLSVLSTDPAPPSAVPNPLPRNALYASLTLMQHGLEVVAEVTAPINAVLPGLSKTAMEAGAAGVSVLHVRDIAPMLLHDSGCADLVPDSHNNTTVISLTVLTDDIDTRTGELQEFNFTADEVPAW